MPFKLYPDTPLDAFWGEMMCSWEEANGGLF